MLTYLMQMAPPQAEENEGVEDYLLLGGVLLLIQDLGMLWYVIKRFRPTYDINKINELLQESEDRSETSQAFKASLQTALARQGYDNPGDELLVTYSDIDEHLLSVTSVYKNRFLGNEKYLLLRVYPAALRMWDHLESSPDDALKMYVFNHEAGHIVAGHVVPWRSTDVLKDVSEASYFIQSALLFGLYLITKFSQSDLFPDTPAVKAFEVLSLINLGSFLASRVMKWVNRYSITIEHEADRAAVTEVVKEYPDYDFSFRSIDGNKQATWCCGLFKRYVYMSGEELIAARDYEKQRAGLLSSVKTYKVNNNNNVSCDDLEVDETYIPPNNRDSREEDESGAGFVSVDFNNGAGRASI